MVCTLHGTIDLIRITDDILAMQRPSTRLIKEYNLVNVFLEKNIRAIFNLQSPFEHASCGDGIEPSGFSYIPEHWMDNGISYYNFGWTDMEVPEMETMVSKINSAQYRQCHGLQSP
jgi:protein tyrosine phosphatase domain-containing protein 1